MPLSEVDSDVLVRALRQHKGFHLATSWYLGWEPLPFQYFWHHIPCGNTTLLAGVGAGKAQPLTSRVLTPRGWRTMGDLVPGLRVITADGSPATILGVFPQGKRPVYKLTMNDGEVVRADEEHRWLVQRRAGRPFSTMTTLQIRDGLRRYGSGGGEGYFLPFVGVAQFEQYPVPVDPYLLGLLLGDGGLTQKGVVFTTADPELLRYVRDAVEPYGVTPVHKGQYDYSLSTSETRWVERGRRRNRLQAALEKLGVLGRNSHDKFIPHTYIYNSPEVRIAVLQGLLDTDGCPSGGGVEYATASSQLAYEVQEIVHSLGGHANIALRYTKVGGKSFPSYRLYISFRGPWPFLPFRLERKQRVLSGVSSFAGSFRRHIVSVEPDGEEETQCILIDHPDHLYITDGWTPTHNTTTVSASNAIDCLTMPGFKALNASVTANQSQLAFDMLDSWIEHNPRLKALIKDITLRPYPIVEFFNRSTFEFRTAGQGAKFIRGHEYDRINYDEAGLDTDGEAIRVLRGRLRGIRPDGTPRMARLDCTGTPSVSVWFQDRFYRGEPGPNRDPMYFSLRATTYDNTKLTPEQIALMEAEYPAELADIELRAQFPDWGLSTFPSDHVMSCINASMYDDAFEATRPETGSPKAGWVLEEWPRVGVVHYEQPAKNGHSYIMAGDPGVDAPPKRNAPCIMVMDITTTPHRLVFFWWGSGHGHYDPFLNMYAHCINKYHPQAKGVDVTGTQKGINELGFERSGIIVDPIIFGGGQKDAMLNSLLTAIVGHDFVVPRIEGLQRQLLSYRRELDLPAAGIPQDTVMTLAMVAFLARFVQADPEGNQPQSPRQFATYLNRRNRTNLLRRR